MDASSPMWVPGEDAREPGAPRLTATVLRMMDESVMVWNRGPARGSKLAADAAEILGGGMLLALQDMQIEGALPPPGSPEWDEFVDQAEAGDVQLTVAVLVRDRGPATRRLGDVHPPSMTGAEFAARLDELVASQAAIPLPDRPPPRRAEPPEKPGPDLSRPGALSEFLCRTGLM
jgi:hypothetical protein